MSLFEEWHMTFNMFDYFYNIDKNPDSLREDYFEMHLLVNVTEKSTYWIGFLTFTLILSGLKMDKVFKPNTWLLMLDPEVAPRWIHAFWKICLGLGLAFCQVKYQESSIGFENLTYLQSIDTKCKRYK